MIPTILIHVKGGLVQQVVSDAPVNARVFVMDYDMDEEPAKKCGIYREDPEIVPTTCELFQDFMVRQSQT